MRAQTERTRNGIQTTWTIASLPKSFSNSLLQNHDDDECNRSSIMPWSCPKRKEVCAERHCSNLSRLATSFTFLPFPFPMTIPIRAKSHFMENADNFELMMTATSRQPQAFVIMIETSFDSHYHSLPGKTTDNQIRPSCYHLECLSLKSILKQGLLWLLFMKLMTVCGGIADTMEFARMMITWFSEFSQWFGL